MVTIKVVSLYPWILQKRTEDESRIGIVVYSYPCCFDIPRYTGVGEVAFIEGVFVEKSCR
jgi:hypothetical protein